jgi:hypothetical protein
MWNGVWPKISHESHRFTANSIESGSGTGKTNVLFKHAVDYAYQVRSDQQSKSICFITVSPRLRTELEKRYTDIALIERSVLFSWNYQSLFTLPILVLYNTSMQGVTSRCEVLFIAWIVRWTVDNDWVRQEHEINLYISSFRQLTQLLRRSACGCKWGRKGDKWSHIGLFGTLLLWLLINTIALRTSYFVQRCLLGIGTEKGTVATTRVHREQKEQYWYI